MSAAITHSLGATHQIPLSPSPEGTRTEYPEYAGPHDLAEPEALPQSAAVWIPATSIENNDTDLSLREGLARQKLAAPRSRPVVYDENIIVSPVGHPGMIDDRKRFKQRQWEGHEPEPKMYKKLNEDGKEDGHLHKHAGLCADEIGMQNHLYFPNGTPKK